MSDETRARRVEDRVLEAVLWLTVIAKAILIAVLIAAALL